MLKASKFYLVSLTEQISVMLVKFEFDDFKKSKCFEVF